MRYNQVVRKRDGAARHVVDVNDIKIPDGFTIAGRLEKRSVKDAEQIMELWSLAHDLLKHVKRVCRERGV